MNPKLSPAHLQRRAIVYIRQSSPGQVIHNQESQGRQYDWPTMPVSSAFTKSK